MPRRVRIEFAGAVYHAVARGNERRAIFRDKADRERFLETLAETVHQFGLRLQAYCLLPHHYHLLLGTPRGNLSRALAGGVCAFESGATKPKGATPST